MANLQGKIIRGVGGFYYVNAADRVYECRARGIFRKEGVRPLVGDDVRIEVAEGGIGSGEDTVVGNGTADVGGGARLPAGTVAEILPRRSELLRPAVANLDQALLIFAVASPQPSLNLLDRMLLQMEVRALPVRIAFNKGDLGGGERYLEIYRGAGYETLLVSARTGDGVEELREVLRGKTTAVAGPSGAGKSSLINRLAGETLMETGEISARVERGRHTTRHSEIFALGEGTFLCDTPGFGSLDLPDLGKEELWRWYPEFSAHERFCRFTGCSHTHEPDCGVRSAAERGEIAPDRYENYRTLYAELEGQRRR